MTERFVAGIVGAPFGIKGFVKVKPLSGEIEHLLNLRSVTLRRDGKERLLGIEESTTAGSTLVMRFAGCDDPETAKELQGAELLVDRENAAPLQPGEYYVEDLKGLAVVGGTDDGEILGHIAGIIEGGGGDLAEITLKNGKARLVPFRKEFFPEIDLEKGILTALYSIIPFCIARAIIELAK